MIESHLVAELHFFTGTMDSGKSTLALQTAQSELADAEDRWLTLEMLREEMEGRS